MKKKIKQLLESDLKEDSLIAIQLLKGKSNEEVAEIFGIPYKIGARILRDIDFKINDFREHAIIISEECYLYFSYTDLQFGQYTVEKVKNSSYLLKI